MGCSCNSNTVAASYPIPGENYGIYGYLPTSMEYTPTDILTAVALIGGMAFIAYVAMGRAEKTKKITKADRDLRRKIGMRGH